jgi:hypothetical protein
LAKHLEYVNRCACEEGQNLMEECKRRPHGLNSPGKYD